MKNGGRYLEDCLNSLKNQTFKNFEVIFVNDKSSDNSEIIAERFKKHLKIKIIQGSSQGVGSALNRGVQHCKGRYICRIDSDDIAHKNRLEYQFRIFKKNKDLGVVSTNVVLINEAGRKIGTKKCFKSDKAIRLALNFFNPLNHPACMLLKKVILECGNYTQDKNIIEDYDLWLKIKQTKYKFYNIKKDLTYYRIHNKSETQKDRKKFLDRVYLTRKNAVKINCLSKTLFKIGNIAYKLKYLWQK